MKSFIIRVIVHYYKLKRRIIACLAKKETQDENLHH